MEERQSLCNLCNQLTQKTFDKFVIFVFKNLIRIRKLCNLLI